MARSPYDVAPDSDGFETAPHPRETFVLFGHTEAERHLLDAYRSTRLPHAWIIGGPEGVGKATLAWRLARFILAHPDPAASAAQSARDLSVRPDDPVVRRVASRAHGDLAVLRREWNDKARKPYADIRVEDIRRIRQMFQQASSAGGYRIAILDSAEHLNPSSANALLKLIEEPPQRSLFLIVAHKPAQVMTTIRSRCRKLILNPLSTDDVRQAVMALGEPWSDQPAAVAAAAARAGGSVKDALKLLGGDTLALLDQLETLCDRLPLVDWQDVHRLADRVSNRAASGAYETVLTAILDWLDRRVRDGAGGSADLLAPFAEVWEKVVAAARETEALNLDKRPLILSIFADLASAAEGGRN